MIGGICLSHRALAEGERVVVGSNGVTHPVIGCTEI